MTFTQKMQIGLINCNYQKQMLADDLGMTRCTFCNRQKQNSWTKAEKLMVCYILDMEIPEEISKMKITVK